MVLYAENELDFSACQILGVDRNCCDQKINQLRAISLDQVDMINRILRQRAYVPQATLFDSE